MIDEIVNKPKYKLADWELKDVGSSYCLLGKLVEKRDGFQDGGVIVTSKLVRIDFQNNLAETKNSFYELIG